jgi:hypothetical protein
MELREVRILDPACGSGNFLYVTLDLLKGLESEVLRRLEDITGQAQLKLDIDQVNPSQFLGIEINPRAAAIADLVIWIGYLKWHFKRFGNIPPVEPVLREYKNIECRDAVLAYDDKEPDIDPVTKKLRTRWGGRMMKHPVTGEDVPDPSDKIPIYRYINPRPAEWQEADYIVSNPPFIGGRLGVGNDPRYNNSVCFNPFPFPDSTSEQKQKIRDLGERLDAHRKRVQAQHPDFTITGMYNLLEKMRSGEPFTDKDREYNDKALVSTLKQIHDELDAAVFEAYGWQQNLSDDEILERLVTLNAERAEEERNGLIRWLRPEYQAPAEIHTQQVIEGITSEEDVAIAPVEQQPWPKKFKEQLAAVRDLLRTSSSEWTLEQIVAQFKGASRSKKAITECLESLEELGILASHAEEGVTRWYFAELQKAS